ncbi:site-specific integrase [Roseomonas eburnea]|uniref:Site-specific integrase n=1 Tax=Neoroseomonas eburnea TaxID=1346889 RepID=A0A9X9XJU2_9PROT|nr:site-specific integrase [Neoroseomonas eburnea]MBR0683978.1 site-specific integrase [Neoroseomonas eburnea]
MPLKLVRRKGSEMFYIRGTLRGERVYESAGTSDRGLAEEAKAKREREIFERAIYGAHAVVTFAQAAASYLEAEPRSPRTHGHVARLISHFGKMRLAAIDQVALDAGYRAILGNGASNANKLRSVLTPLSAVLEHAAVRKWCQRPAFEKPSQPKTTTTFLRPAEATRLVDAAAPHLKPLLVFLIGTGCRLSEALELEWSRVDLRGARAVVWQKQGNERQVDLPLVVCDALDGLPHRHGHVFRPPPRRRRGKLIEPKSYFGLTRESGGQIDTAFHAAVRRAGLPGQWRTVMRKGKERREWVSAITPHDLRHTWASWHYAIHKDPLRLMVAGGWSGLAMTQRYAHLMPEAYAAEAAAWWRGGAVCEQKSAIA